jgi:Fe-S cluster assembly scaffold protein SufB
MKNETINFNNVDCVTLSPTEDTAYELLYDGEWVGQKTLLVHLEHPNVSCEIYCGYKVRSGRTIDLINTITHKAPNTSSRIVIRGVLYDGGVSNYRGKIIIEKTAQGSSSKLDDGVLVVGTGTHNHAEPIMQIETNDVSASHSSFTGRVDESQLYYLQSRGLSREESQDILTDAFLVRHTESQRTK